MKLVVDNNSFPASNREAQTMEDMDWGQWRTWTGVAASLTVRPGHREPLLPSLVERASPGSVDAVARCPDLCVVDMKPFSALQLILVDN